MILKHEMFYQRLFKTQMFVSIAVSNIYVTYMKNEFQHFSASSELGVEGWGRTV